MCNSLKLSLGEKVTSKTIYRFYVASGYTRSELIYLLGSDSPAMSSILKNRNDDISNITHSIIIRILIEKPYSSPVEQQLSPKELFEKIVTICPSFKKSMFGVLLGHDRCTGYRWINNLNKNPPSSVSRLIMLINKIIEKDGSNGVDFLMNSIDKEAVSRGLKKDEIFTTGRWNKSSRP